ncbi:MAG: HNH endonuclease, partial [Prochlorococcaceae cyanobacterium]
MSHIDQPLMLMELLGRSSPAPAQDVAWRILGSAWWAGFTFNGITAYGDGHDSLIGGDELSDGERDALLQLCRQRLDTFREHHRALEVDHIIPKNQGGSGPISNL